MSHMGCDKASVFFVYVGKRPGRDRCGGEKWCFQQKGEDIRKDSSWLPDCADPLGSLQGKEKERKGVFFRYVLAPEFHLNCLNLMYRPSPSCVSDRSSKHACPPIITQSVLQHNLAPLMTILSVSFHSVIIKILNMIHLFSLCISQSTWLHLRIWVKGFGSPSYFFCFPNIYM